jgi:hypothetical protein
MTPEVPTHEGAGAMRRLVVTVGGGILVLVGLLFVVLPFLPGTPLIVMGVGLLGSEFPWVRKRIVRLVRRPAVLWRRGSQHVGRASASNARGARADSRRAARRASC